MPLRHGNAYSALGWLAAASLCAALYVGEALGQVENDVPGQSPERPAEAVAEQENPPAPPVIPPEPAESVASPKIYEPDCDHPNSREEADLCAQRRMANAAEDTIEWVRKSVEWAESQFYATIGEIIALVVTILVAALAVGAAFRANRIARESAERQLRAYVNVASAKIFWLDNRRIRASVIVKNTGQTPARQMQQWMRSDIGNNVDFGPPPAPLDRHSVADLGSGLPMTYTVDLEPLDEPSWTNLRNRSTPFYVWGEISYQDIFAQNVRRTEFRLVLHPDNDTLAPHPEGNHST